MTAVVIVSLLLALLIAGICVFAVVRSYSMKHKPVEYPFKEFTKLDLQEKSDLFVGKQITSRIISNERGERRR